MAGESASAPVVVLGFGTAGASAVLALREAGYDGRIVAVTDADPQPCSPVLTSYYAGGRIARGECFAWRDQGVTALVDDVRDHVRAVALDVPAHAVRLSDGACLPYSKLLVATGAHPVAPGFPQVDGTAPLALRTLRDAERLRAALEDKTCRSVLVAGTSMVALKALEACLDRGVQATLCGRSVHVLRGSAHADIARRLERLLEERGVTLRLSQPVTRARCSREAGAGGAAGWDVEFAGAEVDRFDAVVVAQGVRPNLDFVEPGAVEGEGGLLVDRFMRTSAPDVFAAGDVAQALDLTTGTRRVVGLWRNAVQQGRCAGSAMAAELAGRAPAWAFPGSVPSNVIHVRDILFASAGIVEDRTGDRGLSFEVQEGDGEVALFARAENGQGPLVGFNVLSVGSGPQADGGLACGIGRYRVEVEKAFAC